MMIRTWPTLTGFGRPPGLLVIAIAFFLCFFATGATAAPGSSGRVAERFAPFEAILARHLVERELEDGGLVSAFDYEAALADAKTAELRRDQLERLKRFDPSGIDERAPAIAFWVNAYNFFMIEYLLAHPRDGAPAQSVRDYGSLLDPYRVFRLEFIEIGGERYSLDQVEKEILLGEAFKAKGWWDARVHFAVNCASVGCPPLRRAIYTAKNLEAMLAENTRRALKTPRHLRLEDRTLYLTKLFAWYEADFLEEAERVEAWIIRHGGASVADKVRRARRTTFIAYDWRLNRPENFEAFQDPES